MSHTKISLNINDEARDFLLQVKGERHITVTDTIHRAISVLKWVFEAEKEGSKIQVVHEDGRVESVKFLW
jgi:hypothetical protein